MAPGLPVFFPLQVPPPSHPSEIAPMPLKRIEAKWRDTPISGYQRQRTGIPHEKEARPQRARPSLGSAAAFSFFDRAAPAERHVLEGICAQGSDLSRVCGRGIVRWLPVLCGVTP